MADLPKSCYADTPDDEPSHWKLPLCDSSGEETARQVGMAAAALSAGGFRGQKVSIPDGDIAKVKAKVRAAWKRVNPDKDAADMPAALKATEVDEPTALADPTGTDLYVAAPIGNLTYHRKLHKLVASHLAKHGTMTADEYAGMAKSARGHAGGTAKAAKGRQASEATLADDPYGPSDDDHDEDDGWYKLAKNDPAVNYRDSAVDPDGTGTGNPDPDDDDDVDYCGSCRFFHIGVCGLVEGAIDADDVCDLHRDALVLYVPPQGQMYAEAASLRPERGIGQDGTRFFQPRTFTGASEWVQFLPPPGKYAHSVYGEIDLSPDAIAGMLANFRANTYGQDLPINVEHDFRSAGAVGWIRDMRLAADGSLEVKPEWNERGRALLDGDRFRYVSAEFFESWQDPVSAAWHDHVPVGMAICTRPHFKTNVLRPLAATDGNGTTPGRDRGGDRRMSDQDTKVQADAAKTPAAGAVTLTEEQAREFADLKAKQSEYERQLTEFKAREEVQAATVTALKREAQVKKFTDIVLGRGGAADGLRWFGEPAKNVERLVTLADKFGEDDPFVAGYIADRQAEAKRLKESSLFTALGSTETDDGSPQAQVAALASAKRHADPTLTEAKAVSQVYAEQPQLYLKMMGGR